MRQGPSGVPSAAAGNTSRPDELNDRAPVDPAAPGVARDLASAARNASSESETSTSQWPGSGRRAGDARRAPARNVPSTA